MRYQFTPKDIDRFWSKVDRSGGPNSCWVWTAGTFKDGYGMFSVRSSGKKTWRAHRFAWTITNGPIDQEQWVCHTCDNPTCCNPSHFFLGTYIDNVRDRERKSRHSHDATWHPNGAQNPRAKLTDQQVIEARRRWGRGGVTKSQLAREMGVTSTLMSWVITGKHWKHLPSVEELRDPH